MLNNAKHCCEAIRLDLFMKDGSANAEYILWMDLYFTANDLQFGLHGFE